MAAQLGGGASFSCGLSSRSRKWTLSSANSKGFRSFLGRRRNIDGGGGDGSVCSSLSSNMGKGFLSSPVIRQRKQKFSRFNFQPNSDCGVQSSDVEETSAIEEECDPSNSSTGLKYGFFFYYLIQLYSVLSYIIYDNLSCIIELGFLISY